MDTIIEVWAGFNSNIFALDCADRQKRSPARIWFVFFRNEESLTIEQLVWILPASEGQFMG
jgi:hypothetical protein